MRITALPFQNHPFKLHLYAFWIGVAALATGQDALFAFLKNTSFYWSESLLYKVYWLLFIPQTILVAKALEKWPLEKISSPGSWMHVLLALLSSLTQILVFAALIAISSENLLGYAFPFAGVLRKSLAEDFFTGVLMYGLLLLLFNRKSEYVVSDLPTPVLDTSESKITEPNYLNVFLVKDGAKTQRLSAATIDWIGSEDSYTVLHQVNQKWLYSESLAKLEEQLDREDFIRIHRSCIVNIHRVKRVTSRLTGDYDVHLESGQTMRLSRHYVQKAKGRLI